MSKKPTYNPDMKLKLDKLVKQAESNNLNAICKLYEIYSEGIGVRKNRKRAVKWLHMGVALKDPYFTLLLADAIYDGTYGKANKVEAIRWYKKAANLGVFEAWASIGYHYHGTRTKSGFKTGVKYYKLAALHDEDHSLHNLGLSHLFGEGAKKSTQIAFEYFIRAAKLGNVRSQFNAGKLLYSEMNDRKLAVYWLRKAARSGDADAINLLETIKNSKDKSSIGSETKRRKT